MLYSPCHIYDIKETEIDYIENIEKADNYFDWITYDGKQTQEYQDRKFNDLQIIDNNRPTFSNSINFEVNDITNQNWVDILAVSAGYGMNNQNKKEIQSIEESINELKHLYDNVVDDYDIDINPQYPRLVDSPYGITLSPSEEKEGVNTLQNTIIYDEEQGRNKIEELIKQYEKLEKPGINHNAEPKGQIDVYKELISDEEFERRNKQIREEKKKLNQRELLLQNEEQKLLELLDQSGPPDNMRNRKKPKTYDYNLSLQDLQKDKSKLLNIDNGGKAFFFSYLQS